MTPFRIVSSNVSKKAFEGATTGVDYEVPPEHVMATEVLNDTEEGEKGMKCIKINRL